MSDPRRLQRVQELIETEKAYVEDLEAIETASDTGKLHFPLTLTAIALHRPLTRGRGADN